MAAVGPLGVGGPACAVVVVNWNGRDVLPACLASLDRVLPGGVPVVLVDNASTDGSQGAAREHPRTQVVRRTTNGGFAVAVNDGIRATDAQIVLLVNNDAVVEPGWLEAMVAPLVAEGGSDIGAVTGRVLLDGRYVRADDLPRPGDLADASGMRWRRVTGDEVGTRRINSTGNEVTRSGNGRDRDWLREDDGIPAAVDVFGFNGGAVALRRAAIDDVGGLEESFFLYYEDTELSWRLRRRGWRVAHAHDAITVHRHAASAGTASRLFRVENASNRLRTALRHAPWPVVARAWVRSLGRVVRGGGAWQLAGIIRALRSVPTDLHRRRAVDRTATVRRSDVAAWAVPD